MRYPKEAVYVDTILLPIYCADCGVLFGLGKEHQRKLRQSCDTFYCPNGHANVYKVSEADELKNQLAAARAARDQMEAAYFEEQRFRKATERSLAATRGQVTRIKNRVQHGVCPCCNRTFQNLSRHMAGQHPDWSATP